MKYVVVSIRDRAADIFGRPFYVAAVGQGIRTFVDEINNPREGSALFAHPEDFDLYALGTFDDADGSFECGKPRQVAIGKDVKTVVK